MGKGHRDNYRARKKRGSAAFAKKAARRAPDNRIKCAMCGQRVRPQTAYQGYCTPCQIRVGIREE